MYDALSRALLSKPGLGVETPVNPQETLMKLNPFRDLIFLSLSFVYFPLRLLCA